MPTVLIVGATGNIGTSAVIAALKLDYHVLAIVRNKESADKLLSRVGTSSGITTIEADILSDQGIHGVVEKVRKGELPAFQHVYSAGKFSDSCNLSVFEVLLIKIGAAAGGLFDNTALLDLKTQDMKRYMQINFEPNLCE